MTSQDTKDAKPEIHPRAVVEDGVTIGPDCTVEAGAVIESGSSLEAGVTVGANAVLIGVVDATGMRQGPRLRAGVRVGANATIVGSLTIGAGALVYPGAVVARTVPPRAIVEGNPARIVGYVDTPDTGTLAPSVEPRAVSIEHTRVHGVTLHTFKVVPDLRGSLSVGEFGREIPFDPRRYFMVFDVPSREIRGEHAHRTCHQFLICVRGNCSVVADDGANRVEVRLDQPHLGLYLPPMTWGIQYKYSPDALLLVFASHHYDNADYIRDYDQFLDLTRKGGA